MSSTAYQDNPSHKRDQMLEALAFHKQVSAGDEKPPICLGRAQVVKIS